jgi:hypothetical protein
MTIPHESAGKSDPSANDSSNVTIGQSTISRSRASTSRGPTRPLPSPRFRGPSQLQPQSRLPRTWSSTGRSEQAPCPRPCQRSSHALRAECVASAKFCAPWRRSGAPLGLADTQNRELISSRFVRPSGAPLRRLESLL